MATTGRRIGIAFASVMTALALVAPTPAAAADPPLPDGLKVRFGDDVDTQTRWYVAEAIDQAWAYLAPLLETPEEMAATVIVVTTAEDAAAEWAGEKGISESRARRFFRARSGSYAGLATAGLTVIINDNSGGPGATVHEFVHLFQHELAGRGQGPRWISEGAAQYFDMLIAHSWGIDAAAESPSATNRRGADEWAATVVNCRTGRLPADGETCEWAQAPLADLESPRPFDIGGGAVSAYQRAAVAFQQLIDETSVDDYLCFLESQGAGEDWRAAFLQCFAMEVDDFYRLFDHRRQRGFTPPLGSQTPEIR